MEPGDHLSLIEYSGALNEPRPLWHRVVLRAIVGLMAVSTLVLMPGPSGLSPVFSASTTHITVVAR